MIDEILKKAKEQGKEIYIYAHNFPDGDAQGAAMALAKYFNQKGVAAKYVVINSSNRYQDVLGEIDITTEVKQGQISLIVDTSTLDYLENILFLGKNGEKQLNDLEQLKIYKDIKQFGDFRNLQEIQDLTEKDREDIYVIDHHKKMEGVQTIEETLGLPEENFIRNPEASSACEIIIEDLTKDKEGEDKKIDSEIAEKLAVGVVTDTANLRYIKPKTLENLKILIDSDVDYEKIILMCNNKASVKAAKGMANILIKAKKTRITAEDGNEFGFGIMLAVDKKEADYIKEKYGVSSIQKKIFKMADIEGCSFICMAVENELDNYSFEFRSSKVLENFDVSQLARMLKGGGHYNASGASVYINDKEKLKKIFMKIPGILLKTPRKIPEKVDAKNLNGIDQELEKILKETDNLTRGVTKDILDKVQKLNMQGAHYDYLITKFKTFERFRLRNEILLMIPDKELDNEKPKIRIQLSENQKYMLCSKYNVSEDEILKAIDVFEDLNIEIAEIILPSGKKASIDEEGKIKIDNNFSPNIRKKEENDIEK